MVAGKLLMIDSLVGTVPTLRAATPAVLEVKMKTKIKFPSGFGPGSAQNIRLPPENDRPDPPPGPREEGKHEQN